MVKAPPKAFVFKIDGAAVFPDIEIDGDMIKLPKEINPEYKYALYDCDNGVLLVSKNAKDYVCAISCKYEKKILTALDFREAKFRRLR